MKRIALFLIILGGISLPMNGQILNKIKQATTNSVERAVEKQVSNRTEKAVNNIIDKTLGKSEEEKPVSTNIENTSDNVVAAPTEAVNSTVVVVVPTIDGETVKSMEQSTQVYNQSMLNMMGSINGIQNATINQAPAPTVDYAPINSQRKADNEKLTFDDWYQKPAI